MFFQLIPVCNWAESVSSNILICGKDIDKETWLQGKLCRYQCPWMGELQVYSASPWRERNIPMVQKFYVLKKKAVTCKDEL